MYSKSKKNSFSFILIMFILTVCSQVSFYFYFYNSSENYKDKLEINAKHSYYIEELKKNILSKDKIADLLLKNENNFLDYNYLKNNIDEIIENIDEVNEKIKLNELIKIKKDFQDLKIILQNVYIGKIKIESEKFKEEKFKILNNLIENYNKIDENYNKSNKELYLNIEKNSIDRINYIYITIVLNIILFFLIFKNLKSIYREDLNNKILIKRYKSILNGAPNGLIIIDSKGKITEISKKALQLVNLTSESIIGKDYNFLLKDQNINSLFDNKENQIKYNNFFKKSYIKDINQKEIEVETFVSKNIINEEDFIIMVVIKEKN